MLFLANCIDIQTVQSNYVKIKIYEQSDGLYTEITWAELIVELLPVLKGPVVPTKPARGSKVKSEVPR